MVPIAINRPGGVEANAHVFTHDSVHGCFPGQIEVSGNTIAIRHNGRVHGLLIVLARRDPHAFPSNTMSRAPDHSTSFPSAARFSFPSITVRK